MLAAPQVAGKAGFSRMLSGMESSSSSSVLLDTSVDSSSDEAAFQQPRKTRPEFTMAKFLIQVVGASTAKLHQLAFSLNDRQLAEMNDSGDRGVSEFLQQLLSHFLLFLIYMFQSGRYYKVTKASQEIAARYGHPFFSFSNKTLQKLRIIFS